MAAFSLLIYFNVICVCIILHSCEEALVALDLSQASCTFDEGLCSWEQDVTNDDFNWTRHRGPTPYNYTGPSQDHTSGEGYYMYIESSKHQGQKARLLSPLLKAGNFCLEFYYHMYGDYIDILSVSVHEDGSKSPSEPFYHKNQKGDKWMYGLISYQAKENFQIVIEATVKNGTYIETGNIAIDDISVYSYCPLDCEFHQNVCTWKHILSSNTDGQGQVESNSDASSKESYIHVKKKGEEEKSTVWAALKSREQGPGLVCMTIKLLITGDLANKLDVSVETDFYNEQEVGPQKLMVSVEKTMSEEPEEILVEISSEKLYKVILNGTVNSGENENIRIYQITTKPGNCPKDDVITTSETTVTTLSSTGLYTETVKDSNNGVKPTEQPKDSNSMLMYIIISGGAAVCLIIIAIACIIRCKRRKRGTHATGEDAELEKINKKPGDQSGIKPGNVGDQGDYEQPESVYAQPGAENPNNVTNSQPTSTENDYSIANHGNKSGTSAQSNMSENVYSNTDNLPNKRPTTTENEYSVANYEHKPGTAAPNMTENIYNHTNTRNVKQPFVDQTYSHIGLRSPTGTNSSNTTDEQGIDDHSASHDENYDVLQSGKISKTKPKPTQAASVPEDEYDHL